MLNIFKRKNDPIILYSPVEGELIALDKVHDTVFSSGMMGQGVAFNFSGDTVYSPCDGTILMVASTKHAVGFQTTTGLEVLIHVGMDTVNLQGEGFTILKEKGNKVTVGMPIMKIDREVIEAHRIDLTTPMIVTNNGGNELELGEPRLVTTQDVVINSPGYRRG